MLTLDDLPLLAETPKRKLTKYEREAQADYARSMAIRAAGIDFHLRSYLRMFSLMDIQRMWLEEQAKLASSRKAKETAHVYG
jgi:hypothetical protein